MMLPLANTPVPMEMTEMGMRLKREDTQSQETQTEQLASLLSFNM